MYSTGTASGPKAVLQALATFATSAGFTVDFNNTYTGFGWYLAVHKGSCYINLVADTGDTQILIYGATGYSGAAGPTSQANSSFVAGTSTVCNSGAGPYTGYHFFSTSGGAAYLHVAIEKSAGIFAHFQVGALSAIGGASPCTYVQATNWTYSGGSGSFPDSGGTMPWSDVQANGYVGVTVDSTFRWFRSAGLPSPARAVWPLQTSGVHRNSIAVSPNTFNGLGVLFPVPCFVERAVGNVYAYVGDAPDLRILNMKNSNPKDELTIGSDTWKIFPVISNNPLINQSGSPNGPSSGNYAYAYRKNA